ncbi:hypothetical protein PFMG_01132 [Plasmodium falciparum IGH-CR14]|uniref:Uncharacterized protein n=1 Tax=Plasmodium falciparum IGH-CR14 TaxID=580059 RepID=A0A0L1I6P7_PLAFA|nr:hypothetical protein PFMG_01132 [Plasmodium falciparum IGH-CR14]
MYENKIVPLQMDRRKYLQSCVENMSITFVLFGLWIVIILVQITSYLFSSGFFENLATIFLHDNERNKGDIWNIKSIGMFLINIITLGWLSIFSFYGTKKKNIKKIKKYKEMIEYIAPYEFIFDLINNFMLSTTILNFSVNLLFVLNQFLYFLFKVHEIRNIEFHNCLIHFLPGFSRKNLKYGTINQKIKFF